GGREVTRILPRSSTFAAVHMSDCALHLGARARRDDPLAQRQPAAGVGHKQNRRKKTIAGPADARLGFTGPLRTDKVPPENGTGRRALTTVPKSVSFRRSGSLGGGGLTAGGGGPATTGGDGGRRDGENIGRARVCYNEIRATSHKGLPVNELS